MTSCGPVSSRPLPDIPSPVPGGDAGGGPAARMGETATEIHTHEGEDMSTLNEFVHHPVVRGMRTGAAVLVSGILTGSVVYAVSVVIGG